MYNQKPNKPNNANNSDYFIVDDLFQPAFFLKLHQEFYSKIEEFEFYTEYCHLYGRSSENKKNEDELVRALDSPIWMVGGTSHLDSYNYFKNQFKGKENFTLFIDSLADIKILKKYVFPILDIKNVKIREKSYKVNLLQKLFYKNYYISLKIARYENGSGIGLHTDNPNKITAALLYFGYSDFISRENGGTQFYRKNTSSEIGDNEYLIHEDFTLIDDVSPIQNRLMGFIRSNDSWHGVAPLENIPNNVFRETFQINMMKCTNYSSELLFLTKLKNKVKKLLGTYK